MRYEAMLAAAFVVGIFGAMSQQGIAPTHQIVHNTFPDVAAAPPTSPVTMAVAAAMAAPTEPQGAVATLNKPKRQKIAKAHAAPSKPKQQIAAEEPHHSFWYRLFHGSHESDVATAEQAGPEQAH